MFDAHVHLDFLLDEAERAAFVDSSLQAGVRGFAVPGVSTEQWPEAARVAAETGAEHVLFGVGLHPEFPGAINSALEMKDFVRRTPPDFLGEMGLDARLDEYSDAEQERVFIAQLELAEELKLPVVVHSVRRHARVLELCKGRELRFMLHGFFGSESLAERFCDAGWYLGVGDAARRSPKTTRAFGVVPASCLLTETDEPMAKGMSTVPATVAWLAELRGVSAAEIANITERNAHAFFGL